MNNEELENKIKVLMSELSNEKGYVSSVDMLIKLNYLTLKDYNDWRFGRVEYLEKVCTVNLKKLSTINKTIRKLSKIMKLEESWTAYHKFGKGERKKLIFSKSGDENIEKSYSTHYLSKFIIEKLKTPNPSPIPW